MLLKYNTKLVISYNVIAACIYSALTPLFFQLDNMQFQDLAKMGELYLSLTGVFLFNRIARLEEYYNTWELVYSRCTSFLWLHLGRIIELMLINSIIISFPLIYAYINSKDIRFGQGYWGIILSSFFLGLLGMLVIEITNNNKAGYLAGIGYYFFETSTRVKLFGFFQVFGYIHNNIRSKIYLFIICILLIIMQLFCIKLRLVHSGGNNGNCH